MSDSDLRTHSPQVKQAEVIDNDVINYDSAGWMDRHLKDEVFCGIPSFTCASYEKEATDDAPKDQDRNSGGFLASLVANQPSFVPFTNCASVFSLPGENYCFNTEDYANNPRLVSEAANAVLNLHADFSTFLEIWKPSAGLGNEGKVTQSTVVAREMKDALPDQMAFSVTPSQVQLNSLQKNIIATGSKKEEVDKWYCVFCFNNARFAYEKCGIVVQPKVNGPWRTHVCKDSKGVVICPVLAAHVCRLCGATGKFAHTEKYCGSQKKRRN